MSVPDCHEFVKRVEWEPEYDTPGKKKCFDELVSGPVDYIHIERMDDGVYWMAFGMNDSDDRQVVTFGTKRNALILARTEGE